MKWLKSKWAKLVLSGTVLIVIYKLFNNFEDVKNIFNALIGIVSPIIMGMIIAFFLSKPAEKIAGLISKIKVGFIKKKSLLFGVIILYAAIFILIAVAINFLAPRIYRNIVELAYNIPSYFEEIKNFLMENEILSRFNLIEITGEKISEMFSISQINKYISVISGMANSFVSFFLAIILSIYMILEKKHIFGFFKKFSERFFPAKTNRIIALYGRKTADRFGSYFTGLALDACLVGIVCSIFFSVIKVPYALLLGLLVAFGNLIPFFGPIISNIIIFIITTVTAGPFKALWVIIFQIIFGQIDGNIIQPKIISNSTGISPLLVLVAVIVFGDLFGFFGMIVGVPVFAVIKDIIVDYVDDGKLNEAS